MKQEIKIELNVPDGFMAKFNEATMTVEIVPKQTRPMTWEEFCSHYKFTGEEYTLRNLNIWKTVCNEKDLRDANCLYIKNAEEADAFKALMKLRELRYAWIGDWRPDWKGSSPKYVIYPMNESMVVDDYMHSSRSMSFPTHEMATGFLACFKDLLEQAELLL